MITNLEISQAAAAAPLTFTKYIVGQSEEIAANEVIALRQDGFMAYCLTEDNQVIFYTNAPRRFINLDILSK